MHALGGGEATRRSLTSHHTLPLPLLLLAHEQLAEQRRLLHYARPLLTSSCPSTF